MAGCGCKDVSEKFANSGCACIGKASSLPAEPSAVAAAARCACNNAVAAPRPPFWMANRRAIAIPPLPQPQALPPLTSLQAIDLGRIGQAVQSAPAIQAPTMTLPPLPAFQAIELGKIGRAAQTAAPLIQPLPTMQALPPQPLPAIDQSQFDQRVRDAATAFPAPTARLPPPGFPPLAPRAAPVLAPLPAIAPPPALSATAPPWAPEAAAPTTRSALPQPTTPAFRPLAPFATQPQQVPSSSSPRQLLPLGIGGLPAGPLGGTGHPGPGASDMMEDLVWTCPPRPDMANGQPFDQFTVQVDGFAGPPVAGHVSRDGKGAFIVTLPNVNPLEWKQWNGVGIYSESMRIGFSTRINSHPEPWGNGVRFSVDHISPVDETTKLPEELLRATSVMVCHDHFLPIQNLLLGQPPDKTNDNPVPVMAGKLGALTSQPANRVVNLLAGHYVIGTPFAGNNRPLLLPSGIRVRGAESSDTSISVARNANQDLFGGVKDDKWNAVGNVFADAADESPGAAANCVFINSQNYAYGRNADFKDANSDVELSGMTLIGNKKSQCRYWTDAEYREDGTILRGDPDLWGGLGTNADCVTIYQDPLPPDTKTAPAYLCITLLDPDDPTHESSPSDPIPLAIWNSAITIELVGVLPPGLKINFYVRPYVAIDTSETYAQEEPSYLLLKQNVALTLGKALPKSLTDAVPGLVSQSVKLLPIATAPADNDLEHFQFDTTDASKNPVRMVIWGRCIPPDQQLPKGLGPRDAAYGAGAGTALNFDQVSGLTVRDVVIEEFGWGGFTLGNYGRVSDVCVDRVTVRDCGYTAIGLNPVAGQGMQNVTFSGCTFENTPQGMDMEVGEVDLDHLVFQNCTFTNLPGAGLEFNFVGASQVTDLQVVGCQFLFNCGTALIFDSQKVSTRSAGREGTVKLASAELDGILVDSCTFSDGVRVAINGRGPVPVPVAGGRNPTIRNCTFTNNGTPRYAPPPQPGVPGYHTSFSGFAPAILLDTGADGWVVSCNQFILTPQPDTYGAANGQRERTLKPAIQAAGWGPSGHTISGNGLRSAGPGSALVLIMAPNGISAGDPVDASQTIFGNCSLDPDGAPDFLWEWVSGDSIGAIAMVQGSSWWWLQAGQVVGRQSLITSFSGACMQACGNVYVGQVPPVYIYQPYRYRGDPARGPFPLEQVVLQPLQQPLWRPLEPPQAPAFVPLSPLGGVR